MEMKRFVPIACLIAAFSLGVLGGTQQADAQVRLRRIPNIVENRIERGIRRGTRDIRQDYRQLDRRFDRTYRRGYRYPVRRFPRRGFGIGGPGFYFGF